MKLPDCNEHRDAGEIWLEYLPLPHVKLHTPARLARPFLESRLKVSRPEVDSWQTQGVELLCQAARTDIRRTDKLEWPGCSPPLRKTGPFDEHHPRADDSRPEGRHIGRRHYPGKSCLVEPHRALPTLHGYSGQLASNPELLVEEQGHQIHGLVAKEDIRGMAQVGKNRGRVDHRSHPGPLEQRETLT